MNHKVRQHTWYKWILSAFVVCLLNLQIGCTSTRSVVNYESCKEEDRTYANDVVNTIVGTIAAGTAFSAATFLVMREDTPMWAVVPVLPVIYGSPLMLMTASLWVPESERDRDVKNCLMMKVKLREDLARMCKHCSIEVTQDE